MNTATAAWPQQALLGMGQVRHARMRPVTHQFSYASYFLMLPMRRLAQEPCAALHRNGFGWLSFHDADHGDGSLDCLQWLDALLLREGVIDADGEVWLHCLPRVLGYAFKPVSFWYCERRDGTLAAVVVEVNNTFGERHCYLLQGAQLALGRELHASKVFHVSPFCQVAGHYAFRFMHAGSGVGARTVARISLQDAAGTLLQTSVSGALQPLTQQSARAAFFAMPWLSAAVVARIHWQALRLWLKRVPFIRKPVKPAAFLTR